MFQGSVPDPLERQACTCNSLVLVLTSSCMNLLQVFAVYIVTTSRSAREHNFVAGIDILGLSHPSMPRNIVLSID